MEERTRVHINVARLKIGGETFEVVIDPDLAIEYKNGKAIELRDVLKSERIYSDSKKGLEASAHQVAKIFETEDTLEAIDQIIKKGEVQLSAEYRQKIQDAKRKRIIALISRNGIDPKSGHPHPPQRIENAMDEAKARIDEHKSAEDQIQDIVRKIRTVLPIRFELHEVQVLIAPQFAAKCYQLLKSYGTVLKDEWQNDGSLLSVIEIPAGLQDDFFSQLNNMTHGSVQTKLLKTK